MAGTSVLKTWFLIFDEIRQLLMNLVKLQPDIPILMITGGELPAWPKNWGTDENL
jgi:hypothetical protein